MTLPCMPFRRSATVLRALAFSLVAAGLTGCSTVNGWAAGGTNHSPVAGASVNIPLGK